MVGGGVGTASWEPGGGSMEIFDLSKKSTGSVALNTLDV